MSVWGLVHRLKTPLCRLPDAVSGFLGSYLTRETPVLWLFVGFIALQISLRPIDINTKDSETNRDKGVGTACVASLLTQSSTHRLLYSVRSSNLFTAVAGRKKAALTVRPSGPEP